jgi:hypothetical protein
LAAWGNNEYRRHRDRGGDQRRNDDMTRISLLERLKEIQQTPRFQGRDITTISAVLSNQALAKHIEVCEQAAGMAPRPAGQANAA